MRLVTYERAGGLAGGFLRGEEIVPFAALDGPATVREFIGGEPARRDELAARAAGFDGETVAVDSTRLGPPITNPEKILCIGLNYRDHAAETGMDAPSSPIVFAKFANSLIGPADEVVVPPPGAEIDYEAELAVVIGDRCSRLSAEEAIDHVFGAMAFNDVSARNLQMATSQWTMGKAIDTFAPCGPALVSLDEVGDLQDLRVGCSVNGEVVQDGHTSSMIFPIAETIAYISSVMTLEPGDVIATGTPAGVGMGRKPPIELEAGDVVEVEVERIGGLRNKIVAEAAVDATAAAGAR
ncbi:MAG TPA: fumarylacetoacetate hydrolase family protein [Solirubrobacterales bacterium]|jgi:2-keto-4-pentenoate hydratase/2-oxohepta-3-ene-1,7-dioic acid hydratase in catechol pathway|nr:fumarylacetoacetate hydrolase family protein [Solirubrobacterales bacterium]